MSYFWKIIIAVIVYTLAVVGLISLDMSLKLGIPYAFIAPFGLIFLVTYVVSASPKKKKK